MKKLLALTLLAASLAGAQSKKILAPDLSQEWIDKIHAAVPGATIVKDGSIADADALIGSITPAPVHAFGVVVERSGGIDEHQHRGEAVMRGREVVDRGEGAAGAQPIGGRVEGRADHHDRR